MISFLLGYLQHQEASERGKGEGIAEFFFAGRVPPSSDSERGDDEEPAD